MTEFNVERDVATLLELCTNFREEYCIGCGNLGEIRKACAGCKIDEWNTEAQKIEDRFNQYLEIC